MATALFPLSQFFAPLHGLVAWFAPRPAPAQRVAPARPAAAPAPGPITRATMRPLRVVRVVEPAAPRAVAGRMIISGRLADVCAELDRLAAQEARGH